MEDSVNKLIDILNDCLDEIVIKIGLLSKYDGKSIDGWTKKDLLYKQEDLEIVIRFLLSSNEDILKKRRVYLNFERLSYYLDNDGMTIQEKVDCLMAVITKNNVSFNDGKEHKIIDLNKLKKKYASMDEVRFSEFVKNIDFNKIINSKTEELSDEELTLKQRVIEVEEEEEKDGELFIKLHRYIKEHYLDKINNYDEKDLKGVDISLKELGVSPKIRAIVVKNLKRNMLKPEKQQNNNISYSVNTFDYDAIWRELREVIDFETMMPYKRLTMQERVYYLELLTRINYPREKRRTFLSNCEILRFGETAYLRYLDSLDRLKFYEEKASIQNELEFMSECCTCIETYGDDGFYENVLDNELKQVESWIPKNYEYEESEVQRLLSK